MELRNLSVSQKYPFEKESNRRNFVDKIKTFNSVFCGKNFTEGPDGWRTVRYFVALPLIKSHIS